MMTERLPYHALGNPDRGPENTITTSDGVDASSSSLSSAILVLDSLLLLIKLLVYTSSDRDCCSFRVGGEGSSSIAVEFLFHSKRKAFCSVVL